MRTKAFVRWTFPLLLTLLACAFQTTFWPEFFGSLSAPPFWLIFIIWLSLYRGQRSTILLLYGMGLVACLFTAMPLKLMLFSILALHLLLRLAKERVFWAGPGYFTLASTLGVLAYHLLYLSLSQVLEPTPTPLLPLERLTQVLWASAFAFPVFSLLETMETWATPRISETGGAA